MGGLKIGGGGTVTTGDGGCTGDNWPAEKGTGEVQFYWSLELILQLVLNLSLWTT